MSVFSSILSSIPVQLSSRTSYASGTRGRRLEPPTRGRI